MGNLEGGAASNSIGINLTGPFGRFGGKKKVVIWLILPVAYAYLGD